MSERPSYVIITPVRDEVENLRRLAESVLRQSHPPDEWVIVDNGSKDGTAAFVEALSDSHSFIRGTASEATAVAEPGAPIVRAFEAGLEAVRQRTDLVVKVDADVSFAPDHFERLSAAFDADKNLGIAGSVCLEKRGDVWSEVTAAAGHVRGAVRAYRRCCLEELLPLERGLGWDTVDEQRAAMAGWRTGVVGGAEFFHHRAVGARDGKPWARARRQGSASHYLGYRLWYIVLRAVRRSLDDLAALAMIVGYAEAAVRRRPRHPDRALRKRIRRQQSLTGLRDRIVELLAERARRRADVLPLGHEPRR